MDLKKAIADNKTISKVVQQTWKSAPTIAMVTGVVGSAASLYLMWRAARKHDQVMTEIIDDLDEVHAKKPGQEEVEVLSAKDYRMALCRAYINAGFKLGKLYAPMAITEAVSIWLMGYGYHTLHERYTNTLAMVSLVEHTFAHYRKNVVDILGEDADKQFRYGLHEKEFEVPELDKDGNTKTDKNGVVKTRKEKRMIVDDEEMLEGYSGYARIFGKGYTKEFDKVEDSGMATSWYNREFLFQQQQYFNLLLKYRPSHIVFLNEVYDALGFDRTQEGQVVGWYYNPEYPVGDNEIIFVPMEFYDERYEAEKVILDFNVDGNVWKLLGSTGFGTGTEQDIFDYPKVENIYH